MAAIGPGRCRRIVITIGPACYHELGLMLSRALVGGGGAGGLWSESRVYVARDRRGGVVAIVHIGERLRAKDLVHLRIWVQADRAGTWSRC